MLPLRDAAREQVRELREALRDVLEEAMDRADVDDRPNGEGVRPNVWMRIASVIQAVLEKTK